MSGRVDVCMTNRMLHCLHDRNKLRIKETKLSQRQALAAATV